MDTYGAENAITLYAIEVSLGRGGGSHRGGVEDHDLPIQNRGTYAAPVIKPINPRHKQPLTQILFSLALYLFGAGPPVACPIAADKRRSFALDFLVIIASVLGGRCSSSRARRFWRFNRCTDNIPRRDFPTGLHVFSRESSSQHLSAVQRLNGETMEREKKRQGLQEIAGATRRQRRIRETRRGAHSFHVALDRQVEWSRAKSSRVFRCMCRPRGWAWWCTAAYRTALSLINLRLN